MSALPLHEWLVEADIGTVGVTVFAISEDEAMAVADAAIRGSLGHSLDTATWFMHDFGPTDEDDALTTQEGETDGGHP